MTELAIELPQVLTDMLDRTAIVDGQLQSSPSTSLPSFYLPHSHGGGDGIGTESLGALLLRAIDTSQLDFFPRDWPDGSKEFRLDLSRNPWQCEITIPSFCSAHLDIV